MVKTESDPEQFTFVDCMWTKVMLSKCIMNMY